MMFPVSDEADFQRPTAAEPKVTPLMVIGMAIVAILASSGGFMLAKTYFDAVATERDSRDAAIRRDILRDISTGKVAIPARAAADGRPAAPPAK